MRLVVEVAGIAQVGLDKDDRQLRRQMMPLANSLLAGVQALQSGSMRNQDRKLQVLEAVPKKLRLSIVELKAHEAQFGAAQGARQNRRDDDSMNEAEGNQEPAGIGDDGRDR